MNIYSPNLNAFHSLSNMISSDISPDDFYLISRKNIDDTISDYNIKFLTLSNYICNNFDNCIKLDEDNLYNNNPSLSRIYISAKSNNQVPINPTINFAASDQTSDLSIHTAIFNSDSKKFITFNKIPILPDIDVKSLSSEKIINKNYLSSYIKDNNNNNLNTHTWTIGSFNVNSENSYKIANLSGLVLLNNNSSNKIRLYVYVIILELSNENNSKAFCLHIKNNLGTSNIGDIINPFNPEYKLLLSPFYLNLDEKGDNTYGNALIASGSIVLSFGQGIIVHCNNNESNKISPKISYMYYELN